MSDGQESNSVPWWAGQEQQGELHDLRRRAVDVVLVIALAAGTIAIATNLSLLDVGGEALRDPVSGSPSPWQWTAAAPLLAAYLLVLVLTLLRRLGYRLRAAGLLLLGYGAGIVSLATLGLVGGGTLLLLALPALGLLLLGIRYGVIMAGVSLLVYAVFTLLAAGGWLAVWLTPRDNGLDLARWLGHGLSFLMLLLALLGVQAFLARAQTRALDREHQGAEELARTNRELMERSEQLDRKVLLLQSTAAIARELAASHDRRELLERAVTLVVERLEFDGAAVYLVDDRPQGSTHTWPDGPGSPAPAGVPLRGGRQVWLAAGRGSLAAPGGLRDEGGPARLPAAVSQALARKTTAIDASSAGGPPGYNLAILLPPGPMNVLSMETEPLPAGTRRESLETGGQAGGRITGVLLLHSPDAVQTEGQAPPSTGDVAQLVTVLQSMAGQLALSLEHLRLLSETRASLRELEARYRHYAGEAWQTPGGQKRAPAHNWQEPGALPTPNNRDGAADDRPANIDWDSLFAEARATGEPVVHLDAEQGAYLVAVPVKLRDVSIGVIGFHRGAAAGPWLPEQVASVQAVAERVALAAENLRLLDATQRRAAHDRLLAEVTARMRQSLDIDAVLQAGVREMRQALGIPEVELWLDLPEVAGPRVSVSADQDGEVEG